MIKNLSNFGLVMSLLLISSQIVAQKKEQFQRTDVVYLKNGSIFRGQIEAYEIDKELKLRLDKNKLVIFKAENIKRIVQEATEEEKLVENEEDLKPKKEYAFKERGIFYGSHVGYIGGNNTFGEYTSGLNLHAYGGFHFHRLLGAGLGIGVDFYNVNLGSVIPIYGMARGYLKATNVSPYYQLAAGFGIPIKEENSFFTDLNGGYYISPEIGIRIGGSAETNMTVGIGLQWQKATFIQDFDELRIEDEYTFRRFNFKIGVLF